eukprot:TRINITY_DN74084_c0_g1_i1.p1 TRINITY_DN74084_c0_g1~~TRINITY_DN74084_c0_g1_i1.p1  ORF type:complete len:335 (-),score=52.71 TRINITY_DN74084_c0_g1_i1:132-1136(-)
MGEGSTGSYQLDVVEHTFGDFVATRFEVMETVMDTGCTRVEVVREHTRATATDADKEFLNSAGSNKELALETALRVCKTVDISQLHVRTRKQVFGEAKVLKGLLHPGVVRLFEYAEDQEQGRLVLLLEHLGGGDCNDLIDRCGGKVPDNTAALVAHQLLQALSYCHKMGVVHRDVKASNVMFADSPSGSPCCKLIDFGFAAMVGSENAATLNDVIGTPAYMAPEMLERLGGPRLAYGAKVDVWAIGVLIFQLLTGKLPFGKLEDHRENKTRRVYKEVLRYADSEDREVALEEAALPGAWGQLGGDTRNFLVLLLSPDPTTRPSAEEAARHHWLS